MKDEKKLNEFEWEMRRFLDGDPIPKLNEGEIEALTARILDRQHIESPFAWFNIRPAFKIASLVAAVLLVVFVSMLVQMRDKSEAIAESNFIDQLFEEKTPDEALVELLNNGGLEFGTAVSGLMGVSGKDLNEAVGEVYQKDIYGNIDGLSEEDAKKILKIMDRLGYPDKET